ncbi:hypothetical protein B0H11DRAFT_1901048 [Mycena galericulata]|nr:hypothetical protein B0H11DRAFT_1901048 [Mycena galericulata]
MSRPIPRPRWGFKKLGPGPLKDLQVAMGWENGAFERFKARSLPSHKHVASRALIIGLNINALIETQDDAKLQQLVKDCVHEFPALNDFEGHWPVEIYFRKYTYWRNMSLRRTKRRGLANTAPTNPSNALRRSNELPKDSGAVKKSMKRKERDANPAREKEQEIAKTLHSPTYFSSKSPSNAPLNRNSSNAPGTSSNVPETANDVPYPSNNRQNSSQRKERDESGKENELSAPVHYYLPRSGELTLLHRRPHPPPRLLVHHSTVGHKMRLGRGPLRAT